MRIWSEPKASDLVLRLLRRNDPRHDRRDKHHYPEHRICSGEEVVTERFDVYFRSEDECVHCGERTSGSRSRDNPTAWIFSG